MKEWKKWIIIIIVFIGAYFIPFGNHRISNAIMEAFIMLQEYAQQHVLLCLIPAFFIAGAIANFVSQGAVMKYFGAKANKFLAYSVASISGTILSVCSCTVLPLFAGIYSRGAGIGPAVAFLYSGPAINALAIILTARVLGIKLGLARAIGAIVFSVIIGLIMHFIFIKEEREKANEQDIVIPEAEKETRPLWKTAIYFFNLIVILIFLNWTKDENMAFWNFLYKYKFFISGIFGLFLIYMIIKWFKKNELKDWFISSKGFALQIIPLLFGGVLIAGFLLGRPDHLGIIPQEWIIKLVGGNSLFANFFASVSGALMYFATLTEVPILQGLIGNGMGNGPALALLLAGPALSLPNMLVIKSIIGTKKTIAYVVLVIIMATFSGMIYGYIIN
jgi:uncharacterized membrane protein YraQ (UPF0718 family)